MQTYDPNVDSMSTPIPVNEELARQALERDEKKTVPTGLLKFEPEKNLDESQMADFSTPIEELMPGPGQMMQDEVMGPPMGPMQQGNRVTPRGGGDDAHSKKSKNPGGLTDEQFAAALAGIAAIVAFSKPVQGKLRTMVPKFLGESGEVSMTGLFVTALVAAILFYFAKKFLNER
jgi:hypothetical protein